MVKIAVENTPKMSGPSHGGQCNLPRAGILAEGQGWSVFDVVCTAGRHDRCFEEQHSQTSIAVVVSGTFHYSTSTGQELMSPGSLLLGNGGDSFACSHEHGVGDRCVSFHYSDDFCDELPARSMRQSFRIPRIPAIRELSPLTTRVAALLRSGVDRAIFQEVALDVIDRAIYLQHGLSARQQASDPSSLARITRVLRSMEADPAAPHALSDLAAEARLSPYHFLRCFEAVTGETPHQYLRRLRLRRAAMLLKEESARVPTRILDIALDCGFGDVSNFNRAFRAEFGQNPRAYRHCA